MFSELINSISGRKSVTGNEFTSISYIVGNFNRPMLLSAYFGDFSLHMRSFDHISTKLNSVKQVVDTLPFRTAPGGQ